MKTIKSHSQPAKFCGFLSIVKRKVKINTASNPALVIVSGETNYVTHIIKKHSVIQPKKQHWGGMTTSFKSAFTLVELAIVLVIIGLVSGGILVGKDLIQSAANRAYVSQLETYNSAVNSFKLKYNCLPGDCANATDYGFAGNGDGNGIVSGHTGIPSNSSYDYNITNSDTYSLVYTSNRETSFFWNHLLSASLISETMRNDIDTTSSSITTQRPAAKNDGTGVMVVGWAGKNYFRSGITSTFNGGIANWSNNLSPYDSSYIFEKMGGTTITITNSHGNLYPDSLGKEPIIISSANGIRFYNFQSQSAGGASVNTCLKLSGGTASFNLQNPNKLCELIIKAGF
jgi:prepilin-type N-terminal cleavage/methylation domain-containing protein